jgi:hypothetical protein
VAGEQAAPLGLGVGPGDGADAEAQAEGQFALGRQAGAGGQPSRRHVGGQGVGQPLVDRGVAVGEGGDPVQRIVSMTI